MDNHLQVWFVIGRSVQNAAGSLMNSTRVFSFLVLAIIASITGSQALKGHALLEGFVAALNTKDQAQITSFVQAHFDSKVPADHRAARMLGLADQGAPFKVVKIRAESEKEVQGAVEDKDGMMLGMTLDVDKDGKVTSIRVQPLESLDAPPPKDYSGWMDLGKLAEEIRRDTGSPAMAIAVLHGRTIETAFAGQRTYGKDDPIRPGDAFSIGSIGKPICSTLIGMLIERHRLRWDTTLGQAFPDVPMKTGYKNVTLEQIMHHRGGIPEDPGMRAPEVRRIVGTAKDPVSIRANYARDVLSRDPIAKPGERFAYSNAGYELLGTIAERVMHKPYEALVRDMIFKPLGMTHSYTNLDKMPADRPSGHVRPDDRAQGDRKVQWEPSNFSGPMEYMYAPAGGGMFCSADDLVKFGQMHLNGLRGEDGLLSAATVRRLHKGIPEDQVGSQVTDHGSQVAASGPEGPERLYACGWGIEQFPGVELMHTHNGSNGTMRSQLSIFPKSGVVVAAFVNCGGESDPSPPLQAAIAVGRRYARG